MPNAPALVLDALNSLLEAELNSVFRFMLEGSPYIAPAAVEVRRPLQDMVHTTQRHAGALYSMIESLGGQPVAPTVQPEEQFLAFLSLKFLLPKLAAEKRLLIRRYANALRAIGPGAPAQVIDLLNRQMGQHQADEAVLENAAAAVRESPPPSPAR